MGFDNDPSVVLGGYSFPSLTLKIIILEFILIQSKKLLIDSLSDLHAQQLIESSCGLS